LRDYENVVKQKGYDIEKLRNENRALKEKLDNSEGQYRDLFENYTKI
jgi:hypothetical protein